MHCRIHAINIVIPEITYIWIPLCTCAFCFHGNLLFSYWVNSSFSREYKGSCASHSNRVLHSYILLKMFTAASDSFYIPTSKLAFGCIVVLYGQLASGSSMMSFWSVRLHAYWGIPDSTQWCHYGSVRYMVVGEFSKYCNI